MAAKNLTQPEQPFDFWRPDDVPGSIGALYARVEGRARDAISWYQLKRAPRARASLILRGIAITFAALGALAPLVAAARLIPPHQVDVSQLGYLFFLGAGAAVACDRLFGLSSSWMRYITSALALQRALTEFQLDWVLMVAKLGGVPKEVALVEPLLARLKQFMGVVLEIIDQETQAWVIEFKDRLSELDKLAKTQSESLRPGIVDLTVTNSADADEVAVFVDGMLRERVRSPRCQIAQVSPGQRRISVRGFLGGKEVEASTTVVVQPSSVAVVTLSLPG